MKKIRNLVFTSFWIIQYVITVAQPNPTVDVTITGGTWSLNVPAIDLTEAGNDYSGTYASATNQVLISHTVTPPGQYRNHSWTVQVHKQDINWNTIIELWTRRTGNGTGNTQQCTPSITGGLNFQKISNTPDIFYSGTCERDDVPIQYEIRNVSVLVPAENLSTTIVYTVTITAN